MLQRLSWMFDDLFKFLSAWRKHLEFCPIPSFWWHNLTLSHAWTAEQCYLLGVINAFLDCNAFGSFASIRSLRWMKPSNLVKNGENFTNDNCGHDVGCRLCRVGKKKWWQPKQEKRKSLISWKNSNTGTWKPKNDTGGDFDELSCSFLASRDLQSHYLWRGEEYGGP